MTTNAELQAELEATRRDLAAAQAELVAYRNRLSNRILERSPLGRLWAGIRGRLPADRTGQMNRAVPTPLAEETAAPEPEAPAEGLLTETTTINSFPMFAPGSAGPVHIRLRTTIEAAAQTIPLMVELTSLTNGPIGPPRPIASFVDSDDKSAAVAKLKSLFDQWGSDKATLHDYHLLYGSILADTGSVSRLLEIGIGTNNPDLISNMGPDGRPGASLRAFRDFLPGARIFGADIDDTLLFEEERIKTYFVDQTKPDSFEALSTAVGGDFDLIIDDGLHAPHANIATLLFALDKLKVGGWLVIEDILPVSLPVWHVVSALLPPAFNACVIEAKGALVFAVERAR